MNYELFMGEALAEARLALSAGERPVAAVAVVNDAMVARAHDRVQESNDPTAHAVVVALREAARKLGTARLGDATIFATLEPCAMCVGALLESDVEALVFACPNDHDGAAGTVLQLAQNGDLPRRLRLVTGIRRDEAEELFAEEAALRSAANSRPAEAVSRAAAATGGARLGGGQAPVGHTR
jgi:tRNA(adenine34) deaminase